MIKGFLNKRFGLVPPLLGESQVAHYITDLGGS